MNAIQCSIARITGATTNSLLSVQWLLLTATPPHLSLQHQGIRRTKRISETERRRQIQAKGEDKEREIKRKPFVKRINIFSKISQQDEMECGQISFYYNYFCHPSSSWTRGGKESKEEKEEERRIVVVKDGDEERPEEGHYCGTIIEEEESIQVRRRPRIRREVVEGEKKSQVKSFPQGKFNESQWEENQSILCSVVTKAHDDHHGGYAHVNFHHFYGSFGQQQQSDVHGGDARILFATCVSVSLLPTFGHTVSILIVRARRKRPCTLYNCPNLQLIQPTKSSSELPKQLLTHSSCKPPFPSFSLLFLTLKVYAFITMQAKLIIMIKSAAAGATLNHQTLCIYHDGSIGYLFL